MHNKYASLRTDGPVETIRTKKKSYDPRPSNLLIAASIIMASATMLVVFSPLGRLFDFVWPSLWFLGLIVAILVGYFFLVENAKHLFFCRYNA